MLMLEFSSPRRFWRTVEMRLFAAIVISSLASGCSVGTVTDPVNLEAPTMTLRWRVTQTMGVVSMLRPRDLRNSNEVFLGHALLMPDTPHSAIGPFPSSEAHQFVTVGDVGVWVGNAIAAELESQGYKVEQNLDRESDAKTPTVIKVDVLDVVARRPAIPSFSCEGEVRAHLQIMSRETASERRVTVLDRFCEGHSKEPGECPPSIGMYGPERSNLPATIRSALENMVETVVPDIISAVASAPKGADGS